MSQLLTWVLQAIALADSLHVSKAMESFPEKISVAVFVTALMPGPTFNASTVFTETLEATGVASASDNSVTFDNGPTNPPTTFIYGPKYLATRFYQLSPIQDLELAYTLLRKLYFYNVEDFDKEILLSSKRYGLVRRVFIVATKDNALKKEFQKQMIEKNPPDEVEEIQGSNHMTMMSKPKELFTTLLSIANKYT
uniref:Methylketone synthase I n=1 Tax=Solanum tuberosum TaxID=4113 RepID=M1CG04_SOLTU